MPTPTKSTTLPWCTALLVAATMAGCASPQQNRVFKRKTLDQIYAQADRVNRYAKPYDLGSGDGVGSQVAHQNRILKGHETAFVPVD